MQRPYDFRDDIMSAITYEMDMDLRMLRRKVYTIMDFLGDVGGLSSSLFAIFGALLIIFQYKAAFSHVAL